MINSARAAAEPKTPDSEEHSAVAHDGSQLWKWVLSIAAFGLILLSNSGLGPMIYPDSLDYYQSAESVARGEGFVLPDGLPLTRWPPLYPAMLAIGPRFFGMEPLSFSRYLNAAFYAGSVWLAIGWLQAITRSWVWKPGAIAILLSAPVFEMAGGALSEPPFVFFSVAFLVQLDRYLRQSTLPSFGVLTLLAALAWLSRYIGVVVVATGCLAVTFLSSLPWRRRAAVVTAFSALAALPIMLWLARNRMLMGAFVGPRVGAKRTLADDFTVAFQTIGHWGLPNAIVDHVPGWTVIFPVGVTLVIVWVARSSPEAIRAFWGRSRVGIVFVVMYLVLLLLLSMLTDVEKPDDRFLNPIYIPLVVVAFSFIDCVKGSRVLRLQRVADWRPSRRACGWSTRPRSWRESRSSA